LATDYLLALFLRPSFTSYMSALFSNATIKDERSFT